MSNGDSGLSGIPILGPILDALGNIFGGQSQVQGLANAVSQVEKAAWENTLNLGAFAYGALGDVIGSLGDAIKKIGSALEHLVKDIIFGHLLALIKAIRDFLKHLHDLIAPLIKELQTLQRQYNQIVGKQMRRYLDLIQRIRKILVPFRLLHLGFAKKLDAKLVALESDIGKQWAKLIAHDNEILGVLNIIVDPRNLLRPGNTLGSLGIMIGAIHGAIGAADVRTLFCMGPATAASPFITPWVTTRVTIFNEWHTNTGEQAGYVAQRDQAIEQTGQDLGEPPLK